MALIKCPECKREVSDQTTSCPHCGYKINGITNDTKNKIIKTILCALGIIISIIVAIIIYDLCTVSLEEQEEKLYKTKQELQELQEEREELERKKAINDWIIDSYEN